MGTTKIRPRKYHAQSTLLMGLRNNAGLTLRQMHLRVGINPTKWFRLENGRTELSMSEAKKIMNQFGSHVFDEGFMERHLIEASGVKRGT
jgi:DNA-binding XRE family transcriptional regulator